VAFLKLQKNQKMTPQKDYKNLDLPILGLETITGRSPHEFSEFWRSHPVRGVVLGPWLEYWSNSIQELQSTKTRPAQSNSNTTAVR
jgi:cephalosporin-C deacetylase-like acetyl esterase